MSFLGSTLDLKQADLAATDQINRMLTRHFWSHGSSLSSSMTEFGKTEGQETMLEMLREIQRIILTTALPRNISARV